MNAAIVNYLKLSSNSGKGLYGRVITTKPGSCRRSEFVRIIRYTPNFVVSVEILP